MRSVSILSCCKYQLYRMRFIPLICFAVNFGFLFLGAFLSCIALGGELSLYGISVAWMDASAAVIIFTCIVALFMDFINTAAANGASRATACISVLISSAAGSLVLALEVSLLSPVMAIITKTEEVWAAEIYGTFYDLTCLGYGQAFIRLRLFAVCFFVLLAVCAGAMLISSMYYRLPQWASILIIFGVSFFISAGMPIYFGIENFREMIKAVADILGFANVGKGALGNVMQGAAVFTGISVILTFLSCLIMRHAPVKPLSVKGE